MLPIFEIIIALSFTGFLIYWAFRFPTIFLYIFLLGLPFDHVTIPMGPMRISISDAALVVLMIAWLMDFFIKGRLYLRFPFQVYISIMLLIIVVGATLVNSRPPDSYFTSFSFSVKIIGYILLLQLIKEENQLKTAIVVLVIGALLSTFLAFYQQYLFITGGLAKLKTAMPAGAIAGLNTNIPFIPLRPPSGMNREAAYGIYLSFIISLLLCSYMFKVSGKMKVLFLLPLLLFGVVMVMNDTRAGYLGIFISIILALFLSNTRARYALLILLSLLPLLLLPVYEFLFQHREASLISRQEAIIPVLEYTIDHPFGGGIMHSIDTGKLSIGAHSSFLQLMNYGGIGAMLAYIIILISISRRMWVAFADIWKVKWSGSKRYAAFCVLFATFIGTIIQSELIHPRSTNKDHWVFLAIFFLSPLIADKAREEIEETEEKSPPETKTKKIPQTPKLLPTENTR